MYKGYGIYGLSGKGVHEELRKRMYIYGLSGVHEELRKRMFG